MPRIEKEFLARVRDIDSAEKVHLQVKKGSRILSAVFEETDFSVTTGIYAVILVPHSGAVSAEDRWLRLVLDDEEFSPFEGRFLASVRAVDANERTRFVHVFEEE